MTQDTRILRSVFAIFAALGLSACASLDRVAEPMDYNSLAASRAAPIDPILSPTQAPEASPIFAKDFNVVRVNVTVPGTLRVSEANRYLPGGDIVWREDPIGNRHEQVRVIVQNALEQGVAQVQGSKDVVLDVEVSRFHALTEKARYTVGGVHAIQFTMRLLDAQTGNVVAGPKFIKADFDALGGQAAIRAEQMGKTQKVRITNHLAYVIQQELRQADGYAEQNTGLVGALNQL